MRKLADAERISAFIRAIGAEADINGRLYFTGGATAVLLGWRQSTIDIDIKLVPESDRLLRAIPQLKESLEINVELASPADFIPELQGWQERSRFITREGTLSFYHYDFYAQTLAKIERGHRQDVSDVHEMLRHGLVNVDTLLAHFASIESRLYRYPAIDPPTFRKAVESLLQG